jgi:HNH endonuclease
MNITAEVVKRYPFESTAAIAKDLGVSLSKIYNRAWSLGIKKDPVYLRSTQYPKGYLGGKASQFKPGHTPKNKGVKMPAELYEMVKPTMFKKGNKPHNTKPNGTINIRADSSGRFYQYIKIKDSHWELLQRDVWTQANGEIPPGSVVIFLDGNYLNCELSNLQVISRKENMARNTIQRFPAELQEIMKLTSKLKRKTNGKQQTK